MTVFGPLLRRRPRVPATRERWELKDGDFVDVDRVAGPDGAPLVVALHGLEGSSSAHYIRGLLACARERGWRGLALNFRSCSGEINRLLRSYHSGETGDLGELIARARGEADRILLAGCSLGGNVLVKWLGEQGASVPREIKGAVAISTPFDLAACARTLDSRGFWRGVYRTRFLRTLKEQTDAAIILISHDLGVVAEVCDEVAVMYAGEIVERAPVELLFERPEHPYTAARSSSWRNRSASRLARSNLWRFPCAARSLWSLSRSLRWPPPLSPPCSGPSSRNPSRTRIRRPRGAGCCG